MPNLAFLMTANHKKLLCACHRHFRLRGNRNDLPTLAFGKSTCCRTWGFSSAPPIHKIKRPAGACLFYGGARNLLPLAYERPAPNIRTKWLKTGKNREFLQKTVFLGNFYTTQTRTHLQISKHLRHTRFKIPCKNNREFFGLYQGIISEYQGTLFQPPPYETNQGAPTLPNFDIVVCL